MFGGFRIFRRIRLDSLFATGVKIDQTLGRTERKLFIANNIEGICIKGGFFKNHNLNLGK